MGSSESDSGAAAGEGEGGGAACARCGSREGAAEPLLSCVATIVGVGAGASGASELGLGVSGAGVSSTVECFPVVHGGIARNSSKVRTRGLQHFQPVKASTYVLLSELMYERAPRHLSGLRGKWAGQDGRCSLLRGLRKSCRRLCAHTSVPLRDWSPSRSVTLCGARD